MIYTKLTKKAMKIAFAAHKDQTDKTGLPYIHHPIHLAEQMTDEVTTCVALMHDVVEDSEITFEDLESEGFPEDVMQVLIDALIKAYEDPAYKELEAKQMTNMTVGYMEADDWAVAWDEEYNSLRETFLKLGYITE